MTFVITCLAVLMAHSGQSAETLIRQIEELEPPAMEESRLTDPEYVNAFYKLETEYEEKRGKLILTLYEKYPAHERVLPLMQESWDARINKAHMNFGSFDPLIEEVTRVSRAHPSLPIGKAAADYVVVTKVEKIYAGQGVDYEKRLPAIRQLVDAHLKTHKANERLLFSFLRLAELTPDTKDKAKIYQQIADFSENPIARKGYAGMANRYGKLGKPFELSFTDFVTGKKVSMADLRGKVVLIDFWATWCAPCLQELPHLQEIYKKYQAKGFEIVGVSLDQPKEAGGDQALKSYLASHKLPWKHYYPGKGVESGFSLGWGVMAIPSTFLIDKQGRLAAVDVISLDLESKIEELLKKEGRGT